MREKTKTRMNHFYIRKTQDGEITGNVQLENYKYAILFFEKKGEKINFKPLDIKPEVQERFVEKWCKDEQSIYEEYILNHIHAIDELNNQKIFNGRIVREEKFEDRSVILEIVIKYDNIPSEVEFKFDVTNNCCQIQSDSFFPINRKGKRAFRSIYFENFLTEETIKRMWEPFRDKTEYRLQLLHSLR